MDNNQFQGINTSNEDTQGANSANSASSDQPVEPAVKPLEVPTDEALAQARQAIDDTGSSAPPAATPVSPAVAPPPGDVPIEISKPISEGRQIPTTGASVPKPADRLQEPNVPSDESGLNNSPSLTPARADSIDQNRVNIDITPQTSATEPNLGSRSASLGQTQPSRDIDFKDILNKDILELMGGKNMPEDKKKELYQKMLQTVQNRAIDSLADQLTKDEIAEFRAIAETSDQDKMAQYLESKSINLAELMVQQALVYKTEMVALSQKSSPKN